MALSITIKNATPCVILLDAVCFLLSVAFFIDMLIVSILSFVILNIVMLSTVMPL
jgi:hypothetical protein